MPEESLTQEEIRSSINAAFDSVNLINGIVNGTQMNNESTQEKKDCIDRNVSHLDLMITKTWFSDGLVDDEADNIAAAITAGNSFIASN
tara:strand:- start:2794 stop:3060 length:267 start_codon:yes stop_codon:yes gene_type:complete